MTDAVEPVGIKRTRIPLDSGVTVLVKPLSPFVFQAIRDQAFKQFPDPDPAGYELDYPEGVEPAVPGSKIPAEDNPDYRALVDKAAKARENYITYRAIVLSCDVDEWQTVVEQFARERSNLGKVIDLPKDAWEATLMYCLITSEAERIAITLVAESRLPLTPGEVVNGVRFFRMDISRERLDELVRGTSGVQRKNGRPK